MARGERVGEAYVRIHAAGEGLNREIRKLFDDEDPEFERGGRRNSKAYSDAFEREMRSAPNQTRLRKSLTDALAKGDFLAQDFLKSNNWKNFKSGLIKEFGDAGRLAGDNLENDLLQGMTFDGLRGRLDNITQEVVKAERQLQQEEKKILQEREKQHRDSIGRINTLLEKYKEEVDRISKGEDNGHRGRTDLTRDFENMRRILGNLGHDGDGAARTLDNIERKLRSSHPTLNRTITLFDNFGESVGKAFGKGSRNDFINIIGGVAGGIAGLLGIIPRAIKGITALGDKIQTVFTQGGGGLSGTFSVLTLGIEAAAGAIAIFGAAVVGASILVGPLVSIIGSLVAIVVALAASLSFAVLGGIGLLAGALVPVAAAVGVLTLAFTHLDDKTKKMVKNTLKPLRDEFKGLGTAARQGIFSNFEQQVRRLTPVLSGLKPVVRDVGKAISHVGDYFITALRSPGFSRFRDAMATFLPRAVETLGKSFGNVLGGIGGMFQGMLPAVNQFLAWLQRITGDFAKWANSAKGKNEVADFFDRALGSIKSVGHFLGAAFDLLVALINQGKNTGDNIFDRMAHGLENLTNWLDSHPNAVRDWFKQAEGVAADIGKIITATAGLVAALDDIMSRKSVIGILDGIAGGIRILSGLMGGVGDIFGPVAHGLRAFGDALVYGAVSTAQLIGAIVKFDPIKALAPVFQGIGRAIGHIHWGAITNGLGDAIHSIGSAFHGMPGQVTTAAFGVVPGMSRLFLRIVPAAAAAIGRIVAPFRNLPGRATSAVAALPGRIQVLFNRLPPGAQRVINGAVNFFRTLPGRAQGAVSSLPGRIQGVLNRIPPAASNAMNHVVTFFRGLPGRAGSAASSVVGKIQGIMSRIPPTASNAVDRVVGVFRSLPGRVGGAVSGVTSAVSSKFSAIVGAISGVPGRIVGMFSGLGARIVSAIGSVIIHPHISMPNIPIPNIVPHISLPHIPGLAAGDIAFGPQVRLIGEAGPEAVVPLNRPLAQVDPAVRWLSAIAQGKPMPMAAGGVGGTGRQVIVQEGAIKVYTPNANPVVVAEQVLNRIVVSAY